MTDRQLAVTSVVLGVLGIALSVIFYTIPFMELRAWIGGLYDHLPFIILVCISSYLVIKNYKLQMRNIGRHRLTDTEIEDRKRQTRYRWL